MTLRSSLTTNTQQQQQKKEKKNNNKTNKTNKTKARSWVCSSPFSWCFLLESLTACRSLSNFKQAHTRMRCSTDEVSWIMRRLWRNKLNFSVNRIICLYDWQRAVSALRNQDTNTLQVCNLNETLIIHEENRLRLAAHAFNEVKWIIKQS